MSADPKFNHILQSYIKRINTVIDHIEQNLEKDLSLKVLADVACFSVFHFHRMFSTICGETTTEFVTRKRLEKIAAVLLRNPNIPLNEISFKYGFESPISFSRAFKKFYGVSATEIKNQVIGPFNKLVKQKSKIGKEAITVEKYICNVNDTWKWMQENGRVESKDIQFQRLAYIRNKGSFFNIKNCFIDLKEWAEKKGLLSFKNHKWLMLIHDNPAITDEITMRQSACLTIQNDIKIEGKVGVLVIPKDKYLVGTFELANDHEFKMAWDGMSIWALENNIQPKDGYYFELFHSNSLFQKGSMHKVDICIPIL